MGSTETRLPEHVALDEYYRRKGDADLVEMFKEGKVTSKYLGECGIETKDWPADPWPKTDIGKLLVTLGKPGDPIPEPVRVNFEEPVAVPIVVEG